MLKEYLIGYVDHRNLIRYLINFHFVHVLYTSNKNQ